MLGSEAAQVHYHYVRFGHQRFDGSTPGVAGAEQLGDPEASIRIPPFVDIG
jgi:hypothetical protein